MSDETENNIFRIVRGGQDTGPEKDEIPENPYIITDIDGEEFMAEGFLLFTSQHIAVMRDTGKGALPVLVLPLHRCKCAELLEDDDEEDVELPF